MTAVGGQADAPLTVRGVTEPSYDGLTLTLPSRILPHHAIDESSNLFPRWQLTERQRAAQANADADADAAPLPRKLSAGLLGMAKTPVLLQDKTSAPADTAAPGRKLLQEADKTAASSASSSCRTSLNNWSISVSGGADDASSWPHLPTGVPGGAKKEPQDRQESAGTVPVSKLPTWSVSALPNQNDSTAEEAELHGQPITSRGRTLDSGSSSSSNRTRVRSEARGSSLGSAMVGRHSMESLGGTSTTGAGAQVSPHHQTLSRDKLMRSINMDLHHHSVAAPPGQAGPVDGSSEGGPDDVDTLVDAAAMEEDLAALMKKLPASLRYGARDGGRDIIANGMVQQLYTRLTRLQALLKKRDAETRALRERVSEMESELAIGKELHSSLDSQLDQVTQRLIQRDLELHDARVPARAGAAPQDSPSLQTLLEETQERVAQQDAVLARLRHEKQSLEEQLEDARKELQSLQLPANDAEHTASTDPTAEQLEQDLAAEKSDRQELAKTLEAVRLELAQLKQAAGAAVDPPAPLQSAPPDSQPKSQHLDRKQQQSGSAVAEERLAEAADEIKALRLALHTADMDASGQREANARLRLQVSVLQGSVEVLTRALESARSDLKAANERQVADALECQALARQAHDLKFAAASSRQDLEAAMDAAARRHLDQLLELRNHPMLLAPTVHDQQVVRAPKRATPEPGAPSAMHQRRTDVPTPSAVTDDEKRGADSLHVSDVPSGVPSPAAAPSRPLHPAEVTVVDVDWHSGLSVLERHLQLPSLPVFSDMEDSPQAASPAPTSTSGASHFLAHVPQSLASTEAGVNVVQHSLAEQAAATERRASTPDDVLAARRATVAARADEAASAIRRLTEARAVRSSSAEARAARSSSSASGGPRTSPSASLARDLHARISTLASPVAITFPNGALKQRRSSVSGQTAASATPANPGEPSTASQD